MQQLLEHAKPVIVPAISAVEVDFNVWLVDQDFLCKVANAFLIKIARFVSFSTLMLDNADNAIIFVRHAQLNHIAPLAIIIKCL